MLQILVNKWFKADTEAHKDSDSVPQEFMTILIFTRTIPVSGGFTVAVCRSLSVTSQSYCLNMHFRDEIVRIKSEIALVNLFIQRKICAFAFRTNVSTWNCWCTLFSSMLMQSQLSLSTPQTYIMIPWGQSYVCFLIYMNCPILSNIQEFGVLRKVWRVWGTGRRRRWKACVENPMYQCRKMHKNLF